MEVGDEEDEEMGPAVEETGGFPSQVKTDGPDNWSGGCFTFKTSNTHQESYMKCILPKDQTGCRGRSPSMHQGI